MDSILHVYISWTINSMWMSYTKFERGDPTFSKTAARTLAHPTNVQQGQFRAKWVLCSTRFFCVREFVKTESPTAVQRSFRLRSNIQPPTRKSICRWNHQFEQIGCLCKGKSSVQPSVSEENVRRIQESFERSPRKSTRRASRVLGKLQQTVWRVLRHLLLFKSYSLRLVQALWAHLLNDPV